MGRSQERFRHPDGAAHHPQRVRADVVQRSGVVEYAQQPARGRVRDWRRRAGSLVVGADQMLVTGRPVQLFSADQRLADGVNADAGL